MLTDADALKSLLYDVDTSIIEDIVSSVDAGLDQSVWSALLEGSAVAQDQFRCVLMDQRTDVVPDVMVGTTLVLLGGKARVECPAGSVVDVLCAFRPSSFGAYTLTLHDGRQQSCIAQTSRYFFSSSLDRLYDRLFWSWNGMWTEELETAVAALLIAFEDELVPKLLQMKGMLNAFQAGASSMDQLLDTMQLDFQESLVSCSRAHVGRLHQQLYQILEMGPLFYQMSSDTKQLVSAFERAKLQQSCMQELGHHAQALQAASFQYAMHLRSTSPNSDSYVSILKQIHDDCARMASALGTGTASHVDVTVFWQLRRQLTMTHALSSMRKDALDSHHIDYYPVVPMDQIHKRGIQQYVERFTETLAGSAIMLGSLIPMRLGEPSRDAVVLDTLLHAGVGYVGSNGSLLGLYGTQQASITLGPILVDKRLHKRRKELERVLKNVVGPMGTLQVRMNSSLDRVLTLLRLHHPSSWVDDAIESLWRHLFNENQLIIFELWLNDTLIAADIGHVVANGASFYVATRCYDAHYRKCQPGFLLAFVELFLLWNVYHIGQWNLGDYDSNPQMAYKASVAHIQSRPIAYARFKALKEAYSQRALFMPVRQGQILLNRVQKRHLIATAPSTFTR